MNTRNIKLYINIIYNVDGEDITLGWNKTLAGFTLCSGIHWAHHSSTTQSASYYQSHLPTHICIQRVSTTHKTLASILPKDTSTCGLEELGIEPPIYRELSETTQLWLISSPGVDSPVELRLRGLHQRPVCGRAEQRHPAAGRGPAGSRREALVLQRATQAVPVQPLPAQWHLQGGLEPLRLRLLWDGLPGTLLWERWGWRGKKWKGWSHIFRNEMSNLSDLSHYTVASLENVLIRPDAKTRVIMTDLSFAFLAWEHCVMPTGWVAQDRWCAAENLKF